MNTADFTGQVALVTGAAAGIGLAVSEQLAALGAQVIMLDKDPNVIQQARRLAGHCRGVVVDLADIAAIPMVIADLVNDVDRLDILVNNAGIGILESALDTRHNSWETTLRLNLTAPFFLAQAVANVMMTQNAGRIVNMASQASVVALENHAAYCASKAGLAIVTKVMAAEWGKYGITVNAISPTVVETELGKRYWHGERAERMKAKIPMGRFAQPEEIAAAVVYLAGRSAGMITGENLIIDGGYTIL
jgi:2-deoxy-D-gluconate 3-dehydrogenase